MAEKSKILFVRETFPWMGSHSGYDLLCDYIGQTDGIEVCEIVKSHRNRNILQALLYLLLKGQIKKSASYGPESFLTELKVIKKQISGHSNIIHLLYVERMLGLLGKIPRSLAGPMIGTVHQPVSLWLGGRHAPEIVRPLDALIVLSREKKDFFESVLPGKVHFIRHGVDIEFFSPAGERESEQRRERPRCIFSGVWLRDLETLYGVVEKVRQKNPGIHFDLLVPEDRRSDPYLGRLVGFSQVHWHAGLTDEQLRELYHAASLLLLPLLECTANNALLEGVACGLPVVSNDIGGMPDYTEPSFADLFPVGDVEGMAEAVLKITDDAPLRRQRGRKARTYAENNLAWEYIAKKTMLVYSSLLT